MDDFRKIIFGLLVGFVAMLVIWISFLTFTGCGFAPNCAGAVPTVERTSIPTLIPATLPALKRELGAATVAGPTSGTTSATSAAAAIARPSNPGGPGPAVNLTGDANSGQQIFEKNCQICHGAQGAGGNPNPGSTDGTVPPLNPIDPTLVSADYKEFATNLDLFIEHGSTPEGTNPTLSMLAWGDKHLMTPQEIADVIAYVIKLNPVSAPSKTTPAAGSATQGAAAPEVARPSNPGGPGPAVGLTGDAASGAKIFAANCETCHAAEGKGGNPNPGSDDGTIPALNPIDPTLVSADYKEFATNLDLFIEHGSTPAGPSPAFSMLAWGDKQLLTPQQIADVIAYVIKLNPVSAPSAATPAAAAATSAPTQGSAGTDVARPSNPGGPGPAVDLLGVAAMGGKVFVANCETCHGSEGKGGNPNPGSDDGTIPPLNPVDPTLKSADYKEFATNLDLFIEHGSTPAGTNPAFSMIAWGDKSLLTPQQIADVIAYLIGLNK